MKTSKERTILTVPAKQLVPRTSVKCLFIYVSDYENENQQGENYIDCSSIKQRRTKDLSKVCRFRIELLGSSCVKQQNFGFDDGQPCILLKLNRVSISPVSRHILIWVSPFVHDKKVWVLGWDENRFSHYDVHAEGALWPSIEGRKEMFYLTMHSTHFIYGYMVSDIW